MIDKNILTLSKKLIMAYQKLQAYRAADITPSDTVDIPSVSTAGGAGNNGCVLYCGVAGNIRVLTVGNDDVTLGWCKHRGFYSPTSKKSFRNRNNIYQPFSTLVRCLFKFA